MGADLYIEKIYDKLRVQYEPEFKDAVLNRDTTTDPREKSRWQEKVDEAWDKMYDPSGYFRDSYNNTSIMCRLGISWWQDVTPMLDKKEYLQVPSIRLLKEMVSTVELKLPTEQELINDNCQVDEKNTVESWHRYYREKREQLLQFLDNALKMEEPILCSL